MNNNYNIYILIVDDKPEIHQDFIKILTYQPADTNYIDVLETEIFGDIHSSVSSAETNYDTKFIIDSAYNGIDGVEMINNADKNNIHYAVAFIDIRMPPGIDGIETITKIWEIDPNIQIVICTAYSDYNWHRAIKTIKNNDNLLILKKPFDYMTVHQLTRSLVKKWLLYKENQLSTAKIINKISHNNENLIYQATHDSLTKLPNRNLLFDRVDYTISLSTRNKSLFAILYLDLDDFKYINDNFGHEAGDAVLKNLAKNIKNNLRKQDTVFRVGGDEFIILLSNVKHKNNISNIATNIIKLVKKEIYFDSRYLSVTPSIGISVFPYNGDTAVDLINNADLAMYQAKDLGGERFQFYTKELDAKISLEVKIERQIKDGLHKNQFFLSYLPQIDLKFHKFMAVEALVRLNHPSLGVIYPNTFIPIAEKSGLIIQLSEWILRTAIQQNAIWQNKNLPKILTSVHMPMQHLGQKNFINNLEKYLKEAGLAPQYFGIELAENILINSSEVVAIIQQLKSMGIKIILDNFGSGNMSLGYLQQIPIDFLKLDRTILTNLQQDQNNQIIIKSIIEITKGMKIELIAEGVENAWQEKFLYDNNCRYAQGYYFSKPLLSLGVEQLLQK